MGKKKKAQTGGLPEVKRKLWVAMLHAEDILESAEEVQPELRLKAVHALSQVAAQLVKIIEVGELEVRMIRLEAQLVAGVSGPGRP
jgi:hypothetical protein